jgi:hypothetical protein
MRIIIKTEEFNHLKSFSIVKLKKHRKNYHLIETGEKKSFTI